MSKLESREEMLKRLKQKMLERNKFRKDPDQWMPPKAKENEKLEFYLRVLPPLQAGDTCKTGVNEKDQDLWFYENASHFMGNEKYECPRVHDGEECPVCTLGFELMKDNDDEDYKKNVRSKYLPRTYYACNVYFQNRNENPEAIRGKVMWFNMPKTTWDIMNSCIENDNPGTDEDPKACGIFYHPTEGGYTFKVVVQKKGEYNTYESSYFLAKSYGTLAKLQDGSPDLAKIQKILDQRFVLPNKFRARDMEKLQAIIDKIMKKESKEDSGEETVEEIPAETPKKITNIPGVSKGGINSIKKPAPKPKVEEKTLLDDIGNEENLEESEEKAEEKAETAEETAGETAGETEEAPKPALKQASKPAPKPTTTASKQAPKSAPKTEEPGAVDPDLAAILNEINEK